MPGIAGVWDWLQRPDQLCRTAGLSERLYLDRRGPRRGRHSGGGGGRVLVGGVTGLAVRAGLLGAFASSGAPMAIGAMVRYVSARHDDQVAMRVEALNDER